MEASSTSDRIQTAVVSTIPPFQIPLLSSIALPGFLESSVFLFLLLTLSLDQHLYATFNDDLQSTVSRVYSPQNGMLSNVQSAFENGIAGKENDSLRRIERANSSRRED